MNGYWKPLSATEMDECAIQNIVVYNVKSPEPQMTLICKKEVVKTRLVFYGKESKWHGKGKTWKMGIESFWNVLNAIIVRTICSAWVLCFCLSAVLFAVLMFSIHSSSRIFIIIFSLFFVQSQQFFQRPKYFCLFELSYRSHIELSNLSRTALMYCLSKLWKTVSLWERTSQTWCSLFMWLTQNVVPVSLHVPHVCSYKKIFRSTDKAYCPFRLFKAITNCDDRILLVLDEIVSFLLCFQND